MKVQCGQCPAKYAVSDDRVRDRKVRIHCKRCHASIVVDGKVDPPLVTSTPARRSVSPSPSSPPGLDSVPPPEPESRPSPRPVAHTIMGGLEAPAAERLAARAAENAGLAPALNPEVSGMPDPGRGFTDPPRGAAPDRWRVALTRQDLRWMTTEEIVEAYRSGAVKLETFVFRAGMPNWVTLLEVPEIAGVLGGDAGASSSSGLSPSSLPPPRKSPSSRPPPRPSASSANGLHTGADDEEAGDGMPFALVSQRSSNGREEAARLPAANAADRAAPAAAPATAPQPSTAGGDAAVHIAAPDQQAPAPFAQSPLVAAGATGSKTWLWVVLVLLAVAIAALVVAGPRLGLF